MIVYSGWGPLIRVRPTTFNYVCKYIPRVSSPVLAGLRRHWSLTAEGPTAGQTLREVVRESAIRWAYGPR